MIPYDRNKQQRDKTTPANPSKRRVSLESRWLSVDLASKEIDRLCTNALHRRDKNEDKAPRRTPREEPPAREDEEKEQPNTNKTQSSRARRTRRTQLHSLNGWENKTHPHGIHHGGKQKAPPGKGGEQALLPGEQQIPNF